MRESTPGILMVTALLGGTFLATPARAQALGDRYWIEMAGDWPGIDTDVQVSSVEFSTIGTAINAETDLGLNDRKLLPVLRAGARLGGGWSIGAEFYSLRRGTTNRLARDITFEDVTYPASVSVTTEFNTDIYRFTIGYAFIRERTFEIGGAIGVHATDVEASIEGDGRIGDAAAQFRRRTKRFLAPMPTVGLFANVQVLPRLTLGGRIDYLSLSVGDYDSRLINAQVSAAYRFLPNVGIGVMYSLVDYRVDVEKELYTGRIAYRFSGPAAFLQLGF